MCVCVRIFVRLIKLLYKKKFSAEALCREMWYESYVKIIQVFESWQTTLLYKYLYSILFFYDKVDDKKAIVYST